MTFIKEQIVPALAVLVVAALSAVGALALILNILFLYLPPVILHFTPLGLSLYFYFKKQYTYLYITTGAFVAVVGVLVLLNLPDPFSALQVGWANLLLTGGRLP